MHNHLRFLLGLRAPRLVQALREVPERGGEFPTALRVLAVAKNLGDPAAKAALHDLARAIGPPLDP